MCWLIRLDLGRYVSLPIGLAPTVASTALHTVGVRTRVCRGKLFDGKRQTKISCKYHFVVTRVQVSSKCFALISAPALLTIVPKMIRIPLQWEPFQQFHMLA